MDAHALLTSQGWRGTGHSLHKSDDRIGLAKPILVSRKNNVLGVGRKSHVTSDQWWLNALDEQLKNLDTSGKTSIVQNKTAGNKATKLDALLTHGAGKYSGANGLYSFFVSGGLLQGTLIKHDEEGSNTEATTTPEAEEAVPVRKESKEERRARREEKRKRKAAKLAKQELRKSNADAASTAVTIKGSKMRGDKESKEERRARKEAKRKRHEDKEKKRKAGGG
ncbi:hypothetical protein BD289DRAFT_372715 [Coniella lustricola]|uniref:G-patch domain-containing protein n=1 Tax=Coniella lustricola TaxID=2025994 RepID=A0A2T3A201_9PEZI|nr:hypothetical protein BD289DRAFT_372715 [Coniella lustricola]